MPREHLSAGFFGKLPGAGDFVSRNLDPLFVGFWDRFVSRHLAAALGDEGAAYGPGLRFMLGPEHHGPLAGVVMPSRDRAGRRFPLSIASPCPPPFLELPLRADAWFEAAEAIGGVACSGSLTAERLDEGLRALPFPARTEAGEPVAGIVFWTDPLELHQVDEKDPGDTIRHLLGDPVRSRTMHRAGAPR